LRTGQTYRAGPQPRHTEAEGALFKFKYAHSLDEPTIRHSGHKRAKIVEWWGPLGPGGVGVYRVMVRRKPKPVYIISYRISSRYDYSFNIFSNSSLVTNVP
jgi:hypothetical protein